MKSRKPYTPSDGVLSLGLYLIAITSTGWCFVGTHWWERVIWALAAAFAFRQGTQAAVRAVLKEKK